MRCHRSSSRFGAVFLLWALPLVVSAERINQEGRILGPAPVVTQPLLFNTAEADAVVSALQIFPVDNPWNEDVSRRPVLANSDAMIAKIISELASDRRTLRVFHEMNYVLVPDNQPGVGIEFVDYPEESDPGPYPIPVNLPIETWPRETPGLSLYDWQIDLGQDGGDRHAIMVQPGTGAVYETWQTLLTDGQWQASNGAKFSLLTNGLRPAGWTSGDAAGLPMFSGVIRYDECQRGMVEHAVRIVVKHTRNEYLYPARHRASVPSTTDPAVPAMGQRLRLKAGFAIPDSWGIEEKAVLRGLKKYGALVADNGNFFSLSATPDDRFRSGAFDRLRTLSITNFEVVVATGPTEGPRSPGAPVASAGADRTVPVGVAVALEGAAVATAPVSARWSVAGTSTNVLVADATRTNSLVTFAAAGVYVLVLGVDDGVHAVAYDAVTFTAGGGVRLEAKARDGQLALSWSGGVPPYVLETTAELASPQWQALLTTSATNHATPLGPGAFYRIRTAGL